MNKDKYGRGIIEIYTKTYREARRIILEIDPHGIDETNVYKLKRQEWEDGIMSLYIITFNNVIYVKRAEEINNNYIIKKH